MTLIEKYMRHVIDCEGEDFISNIGGYMSDQDFTEEEKKNLNELSQKISLSN